MHNNETLEMQAFKAMIAEKCKEALAPLYEQLEELKRPTSTPKPQEPTPTPEEVEDAKFMAQLKEMKKHLRKDGLIK